MAEEFRKVSDAIMQMPLEWFRYSRFKMAMPLPAALADRFTLTRLGDSAHGEEAMYYELQVRIIDFPGAPQEKASMRIWLTYVYSAGPERCRIVMARAVIRLALPTIFTVNASAFDA